MSSAEETFATFIDVISTKKNIVVLAGAGISVSCGIPDFRSQDGLYNTLNYKELGLVSPEDLFDIETFKDDPRPFFRFAQNLYPGKIDPSPSHNFLAWLDKNNMLLRVYTQNVDGLEQQAGVHKNKVVHVHGSLLNATCMKCNAKYSAADIASDVNEGQVPLCQRLKEKKPKCRTENAAMNAQPTRTLRKRSFQQYSENNRFGASNKDDVCGGVVKPNITFFGEKLGSYVGQSLQKDYEKADALIVMGTSLSVAPMSKLVDFLHPSVYRVLINRNIIHSPSKNEAFSFDVCLLGNCDDVTNAMKQQLSAGTTSETIKNLVVNNASWLKNQSPKSVLLFNGAITNNTSEESSLQKLLVYCDGCKQQIERIIYCCKTCFDFDLCSQCYPQLSQTHADGTHDFVLEEQ